MDETKKLRLLSAAFATAGGAGFAGGVTSLFALHGYLAMPVPEIVGFVSILFLFLPGVLGAGFVNEHLKDQQAAKNERYPEPRAVPVKQVR